MAKEIYFSIIMTTYNRSDLISRAIESVLNQIFTNWELIIVLDGCTDDTLSICQDYKDNRIKIYTLERSGQGRAANFGIDKAKGGYVCFLDDDDYYLNNHLSTFYATYNELGNTEVILRNGFYREINGERIITLNYSKVIHNNPVRYATLNMCSVCSLSIPAGFLIEDNFPLNFPNWLDTHLILRLLAKHSFVQNDIYTYVYVIHYSMGSRKPLPETELLAKAEGNIEAMKNFQFGNKWIIEKYLLPKDFQFIIAEKYLMYSIKSIKNGYNSGIMLFKKSLSNHISIKLIKSYIKFIILLVKEKIKLF